MAGTMGSEEPHVVSSLGLVFASYTQDWVLQKLSSQKCQGEQTKKLQGKSDLSGQKNQKVATQQDRKSVDNTSPGWPNVSEAA